MRTFCVGALAAGALCGATPVAAAVHAGAHGHAHGSLAHVATAHIAAAHMFSAPAAAASAGAVGQAVQAAQAAGSAVPEPYPDRAVMPGTTPYSDRPWIEGYDPAREDELFRATYPLLATHNILKIYIAGAGDYDAAGIRFSARVPHTERDIDASEIEQEAATLIRTAFERFPDLQTVDVWATIPVDKTDLTSVESTVFSVSADRSTYMMIRDRDLSDAGFLTAFGRLWLARQVPR